MLPRSTRLVPQLGLSLLCRRQRGCKCRCRRPGPAPRRDYHPCARGTVNFYRFRAPACLVSEDTLRAQVFALKEMCSSRGVLGTVILATEGVNGSLAGELEAVRDVVDYVSCMPRDQWSDGPPELVKNIEVFDAPREAPFNKLKIKVKPEIVTMRAEKPLDMNCRGVEVPPEDWDDVIAADDVVVLDTRNTFESAIGTFSGAVVPPLSKFSEFPKWAEAELIPERSDCEFAKNGRHRRVAMFCTGGIRCEKASAYLLQYGGYKPNEVLQLKGGIQSYLTRNAATSKKGQHDASTGDQPATETPSFAPSTWKGHCFVFDDRTAVDGAGQSIAPAEAERLAIQLGPRAGKSLRKRLAVAAAHSETVRHKGVGTNAGIASDHGAQESRKDYTQLSQMNSS